MNIRTRNIAMVVLGFCFLLVACDTTSAVLWSGSDLAKKIFNSPDVNLKEKSYAAADYIVPQIKTYIHKRNNTISTSPLSLVKESAATSEFGRTVPAQIAERLQQLGYTVILPDENGAAPEGDFVISGTYDKDSRTTSVNLRVSDTASGKVVGSVDFNMPTTSDISKMAAPEARIYKLNQNQ